LEAARHIVRLGVSKLIIAVRSTEKGEAAKRSIEQSTNCDANVIEVWPLDLCSYASVKAFAARASRDLPRIDALLENAGVALLRWGWAEDNELMLTVNVVSTFLLAFLLLPKLKETAIKFNTRPNLTFVTSDTHFIVDFNEKDAPEGIFNHMNEKSTANVELRYATSKLMEIYIAREMAARRPVDAYPVTINLVNPGLCESELTREGDMRVKILKFFLARTTEVGSRTLVHGADAGPETHGEYLNMCQVTPTARIVRSPEGQKAQKRLWDELMDKLDKIEPGVSGNL
jgi:NAD(P)-dependent dehydrogenase (short-subunit alcohol dehydrogenase family)